LNVFDARMVPGAWVVCHLVVAPEQVGDVRERCGVCQLAGEPEGLRSELRTDADDVREPVRLRLVLGVSGMAFAAWNVRFGATIVMP
jgi:hypothetical protein